MQGWKTAQASAIASGLFLLSIGAAAAPKGSADPSYSSVGEISLMASYSRSDTGSHSYSTERHYTATLGINLAAVTELELSYSSSKSFVNSDPYQTTTTYGDILGASLVQTLVPASWPFQPYAKAGIGQYNRKQVGTINGIPTAPVVSKSPSAILGGGLRVFLSSAFSLKVEAVAYLPNMKGSAKHNYSVQAGVGWHF